MATKRKKSSTSRKELYTKVVGKTGITFRKVSVKVASPKKKTKRKK